MKRKPLRIKKKRGALWKNTVFTSSLLLLVCFGGLWYGIGYSGVFSLKNLSVTGIASPEKYAEAVRDVINAPSLLPRDNILFFPLGRVENLLLASFPEIRKVKVERDVFGQRAVVAVLERKAVALLCEEQGECLAVDEEGVAIRKEYDRSHLPLFFRTGIVDTKLGSFALEESLLNMFLEFKKDLEGRILFQEQSLSIFSFLLKDSSKADILFSEGWVSFVDTAEDMEWQKEKLMQVLEKQVPREKRKDLEYIDVRFGDQAYIKYR